MWGNTLLIHTSDNGGSITPVKDEVRGNNNPLRGGKNTPFEGGVRVPAFVAGGYVPKSRHGKKLAGTIHIADWYTTLANLAGLSLDDSSSKPDAKNVWPYLTGEVKESPRKVVVLSTRNTRVGSMDAFISGSFKLLLGHAVCDCFVEQTYPVEADTCNCDTTKGNLKYKGGWLGHKDWGIGSNVWLFNLDDDPQEEHNLAETHPSVVARLKKAFETEKKTALHHIDPDSEVSDAVLAKKCEAYTKKHRGYLGPFMD